MDMLDREEEMKLSIIIPVYNAERFLKRCLDSVIIPEDHLKEVEVIIVDDGSTDKSPEIIDAETDRVGFRIIHKPNGGCCSARNAGIKVAKGDYITHLDADDELVDGAVEKMLQLIDLCDFCDMIQFNFYKHQNGEDRAVNSCQDRGYSLKGLPAWWVLVWNKLYKRSFIQDHDVQFLEGLNYDDDAHYNLQCFRYLPTIYGSAEILVRHHYDNEGSITHTLNKDKFINATIATVELLREDNPPIVERLIRERIVFKWTGKQYVEIFGG